MSATLTPVINIDPGYEDEELILGQTALCREVAETERGDQDVEHQHNRVQHCGETVIRGR
jgi:hypothetical protein